MLIHFRVYDINIDVDVTGIFKLLNCLWTFLLFENNYYRSLCLKNVEVQKFALFNLTMSLAKSDTEFQN